MEFYIGDKGIANEGYEEIEFGPGQSIFDCMTKLLQYKNKKVCGDFNGKMLYSDIDTIDSAYLKITGVSYEQFQIDRQKEYQEYDRKEKEHKAAIPELSKEWIERGHAILEPDKWDYWDRCVPVRLGDLYHGMELGCCLDIINILKCGDLEAAKQELSSQGHSGMSHGLVCGMVAAFYDKGQEFIDYIKGR